MGFNQQIIAKNTILLYIRMFITMAISLYSSRVILINLGVEDYGTYNIVAGAVVLFSFLSSPLTTSLQRFLNVEIGKGNPDSTKKVFNSSIISYLIIIFIVVILCETIGRWVILNKLNIPENRVGVAQTVYHISIATFCLSTIKSPFESVVLAYQQMGVFAVFSIIEAILKLLFAIFLSLATFDKLLFYTLGLCSLALAMVFIYYAYDRHNFSIVRFSASHIDKKIIKNILTFSGWTTFGSVVYMGLTTGMDFILNSYFGVVVNAAVGIKNQVVSVLYSFVSNFQVAFKPQLFQLYGANELDQFYRLICFSSKLSAYLYFLLVFPFLPVVPIILQLWLSQTPDYAVDFVRLGLYFNIIAAIDGPLWMSVYATGNIKKYQLIMNIIELTNIPLIIMFCAFGYPPQIAFVVRIVVESIVFFVRWWYLKKFVDFPLLLYIKKAFIPITMVMIPMLILSHFLVYVELSSMNAICIILLQLSLAIFLIYTVGLNREERSRVQSIIKSRILKRFTISS